MHLFTWLTLLLFSCVQWVVTQIDIAQYILAATRACFTINSEWMTIDANKSEVTTGNFNYCVMCLSLFSTLHYSTYIKISLSTGVLWELLPLSRLNLPPECCMCKFLSTFTSTCCSLMYIHRMDILKSLCRVMENNVVQDTFDFHTIDPDPSYALTYDNMLKMLAIQMRFRYLYCCL